MLFRRFDSPKMKYGSLFRKRNEVLNSKVRKSESGRRFVILKVHESKNKIGFVIPSFDNDNSKTRKESSFLLFSDYQTFGKKEPLFVFRTVEPSD